MQRLLMTKFALAHLFKENSIPLEKFSEQHNQKYLLHGENVICLHFVVAFSSF